MQLKYPNLQLSSPSTSSLFFCLNRTLNPKFSSLSFHFTTLHLSLSSKPLKSFSSSSISQSPEPLFLPFLQEPEEQEKETEEEEVEETEQQKLDLKDPITRFFKSRTSAPTPDPKHRGRVEYHRNKRSLWRLAKTDFAETEMEDVEDGYEEEIEQFESGVSSSGHVEAVSGKILEIARNVPENTTLGELLGSYVGKIDENECVKVLSLMGDESLVNGCLYFFEWMGLQEPSLVTRRAYIVMFTLLGREGMAEKLMVLFRNVPPKKEFRDVHLYNSVISGLSSCQRFDDVWEVYKEMETNKINPTHVTCSIMITAVRRSGRSAKDAWAFFQLMNTKGVEWSLEALGALIKSFCDDGLKEEALIIQSEMEKKGILSNTVIYNTLMDAYSKANQIEEAEGLFIEMKEKGLKPTSVTYNILMDAYSRRMQPDIIEGLLAEMQGLGLEPNVKSYTCLISAYGRQKMSDKATDAFLKMKKLGIKPTSHSYTALIHAYSVDGWQEKAYKIFENMKKDGVRPSVQTYTALLDAFRRVGDTQTLMEIWKTMMHDKIEGTRVTFNIVLDGFAKQGHYSVARDVVSEFGRFGLKPTVMTYNMLMNAYARGGQHEKLPQLLKEMAALNLKPDSITYSTMIYAYVRVRDFNRAFYYHKQMVENNQVPDRESYQKLRDILDVKAAIKNRKDRSALAGFINSKVGLFKEKRKGKKDEFWKNKKKRTGPIGPHGTRRGRGG